MPAWACMRQSCLPVAVCSACRSPQSCARQCGVARHWERTTPAAGSMWVARQAWPVRVSTQRWCRAARSGAVAIGVALQNGAAAALRGFRSEEHTSELQSRFDLVCRLLLEKKKEKEQTERQTQNKHVHNC